MKEKVAIVSQTGNAQLSKHSRKNIACKMKDESYYDVEFS